MQIHFKAHGTLLNLIGGIPNSLDMPGHTLGDLVDFLGHKYGPRVKAELLDEESNLDFQYAFFIRGERQTELTAPIREGDEVVIISVLGGGGAGPEEGGR